MIRVLPFVIELAVLIYCLLDCLQTPAARIRTLPKLVWIGLIIVLPVIGGITWLIAGRPSRTVGPSSAGRVNGAGGRVTPWPGRPVRDPRSGPGIGRPRRAVAPDDDDAFLSRLGREAEDERLLDEWEADQRRLGQARQHDTPGNTSAHPADARASEIHPRDDEPSDGAPGTGPL